MTILPKTTFTIPFGDFTTSGGSPNIQSFIVEVEAASFSVPVESVSSVGSGVVVVFNGNASSTDQTTLSSLAADHVGGSLGTGYTQSEAGSQQDTAADSNDISLLTFDSGPLPAGEYILWFYGEHKVSAATPGVGSKLTFKAGKNGGGFSNRGADTRKDTTDWTGAACPVYWNLKDGDSIQAETLLRRWGSGTTEIASAQRVRIILTKQD